MFVMIMKLNEYGVNDELLEFWNKEAGSVRNQIRWAKLEFAKRIWLGNKLVLSVSNSRGESEIRGANLTQILKSYFGLWAMFNLLNSFIGTCMRCYSLIET